MLAVPARFPAGTGGAGVSLQPARRWASCYPRQPRAAAGPTRWKLRAPDLVIFGRGLLAPAERTPTVCSIVVRPRRATEPEPGNLPRPCFPMLLRAPLLHRWAPPVHDPRTSITVVLVGLLHLFADTLRSRRQAKAMVCGRLLTGDTLRSRLVVMSFIGHRHTRCQPRYPGVRLPTWGEP